MEKQRQLDFNAPLLSARRYSSPSNSTELIVLKRKPTENPLPIRQQHSLPPPKPDWENDAVTRPLAVPFHWEQIPGRPKTGPHTPEEPSTTPRLPPGTLSGEFPARPPPGRISSGPSRYTSGERLNDSNIYRPQVEAVSFGDHASLLEKLNESLNCRGDESGSESGEDAFSDALDTLSLTGSWSLNYSVSGISGYQSSDVMKPSGTFCVDAQTRDFMMSRFLPAAKAAVLETPNYVAKKSPVVNEQQPKQVVVRKVVSGEVKPSPSKQYGVEALSYYCRYMDNVESEDEDKECVNVPPPVKKAGKAWGIIPRFCVKNSLCLLNPLPGMIKSKTSSKIRAVTPSSGEVRRRLTRNAHSGPLDKNACHVPHQKKFHSGLLLRIENELESDSIQLLNSYKPELSPLRRYRSGSISPYRNESPKSAFREGAGFLGVPKVESTKGQDFQQTRAVSINADKIASSRKLFKALQDVSRNQTIERGLIDAAEKTVCIDSVSKKELPSSKPSLMKADKSDQAPNTLEEGKKICPEFGSTDKFLTSEMNQSIDDQYCRAIVCTDGKVGVKEEEKLGLDDRSETNVPMKSPLPPPLPKSPSESWLWRTLPNMNPFSHSHRSGNLQSKKQKGSDADTKWQTIVKTSTLRHDHVRYSEELIPLASHGQSKS